MSPLLLLGNSRCRRAAEERVVNENCRVKDRPAGAPGQGGGGARRGGVGGGCDGACGAQLKANGLVDEGGKKWPEGVVCHELARRRVDGGGASAGSRHRLELQQGHSEPRKAAGHGLGAAGVARAGEGLRGHWQKVATSRLNAAAINLRGTQIGARTFLLL